MHTITKDSIVVGMDVHKYAHTAVALNVLGQEQSTVSFSNDELDRCINWLAQLGSQSQIVIGMEDVTGHGIHVSRKLMSAGFHLSYVPPVITDRLRKHSVHKEKNDQEDARRVGIAILTRAEEALPASHSIPKNYDTIRTMDLLLQEREMLSHEQTMLKNQLHVLLHQHYGNGYKQSFRSPFSKKALVWYQQDLNSMDTQEVRYLAASIIRHIDRLLRIQHDMKQIDTDITHLGSRISEVMILKSTIRGCGMLTASKVFVEIKTIKRFDNRDKLARYAGIAPTDHGSAGKARFHTDFSGNRKLNRAIHTIALSQLGRYGLSQAKAYVAKKVSEGKSKLWAIRCLKRRIINTVFMVLTETS